MPKIASINGGAGAAAGTALSISAAQYTLGTALLAKLNYAGTTVNGVTAAAAKALVAAGTKDDNVAALTVSDSSANIAENLDDLQGNRFRHNNYSNPL